MGGATSPGGASGTGGATSPGGASGTGGATSPGGASGTGGGSGTGPACPKPAPGICHEFYANDNGRNQINYVNEFTGKGWTVPVGDTGQNSPRTIEIVDNAKGKTGKAVLVSLDKGYGEFDVVDGASLVKVQQFTAVTGACRMPDGTTALAVNNDSIRIVGSGGNVVRQFALPTVAGDVRAINRNPKTGNFWFSKTEHIFEVTDQGKQVWHALLGTGAKGFSVWWREGGGAYATTGDPATVLELDAAGSVVNQVGGEDKFPSLGLDWFSGFVRLSNGNYVVSNWLGHLTAPKQETPQVLEFTPDNMIVWQWGNQTLARQITNVYVIR